MSDLMMTTGDIAERLQRPHHQITYCIASRNIKPIRRVGNARVFDSAAVARIEAELCRLSPLCRPAVPALAL